MYQSKSESLSSYSHLYRSETDDDHSSVIIKYISKKMSINENDIFILILITIKAHQLLLMELRKATILFFWQ